jgi:choline dehydrogenase
MARADGYDLAIVGAGAAGCVLAARLSESEERSVLLLEAGPDYPSADGLPADLTNAWMPTRSHDWGFASEPDALGRTVELPRARLVGGCSATNAAFAMRGSPADFDAWAGLGNVGWSFADVLPGFKAAERDLDYPGEDWHGRSGPVPIRRYAREELGPPHAATLQAARANGHPSIADHNRPWAVGAGPAPMSALGGVRMSTALTYLAQARGRPNLTIRPDVLVDRVVLRNGRATGVRLAQPPETVHAGTVVLAAGAYGSPAILMRSGIGSPATLAPLGIDVAADLAGVGEGLADHPLLSVDFPASRLDPPGPRFQVAVTWHSSQADHAGAPDLFLGSTSAVELDASPTGAGIMLLVAVLQPQSLGRVRLRSRDPSTLPRIELAHLREASDVARLVEAIRMARRLGAEPPLAALTAGGELSPGPGIAEDDVLALERFARATVTTFHHPIGTCRMGADPSAGAVVDALGRVHGLEGLWVADASIMPSNISAPTNLATIMIAERIARLLDK